jgi:hypothetical protein
LIFKDGYLETARSPQKLCETIIFFRLASVTDLQPASADPKGGLSGVHALLATARKNEHRRLPNSFPVSVPVRQQLSEPTSYTVAMFRAFAPFAVRSASSAYEPKEFENEEIGDGSGRACLAHWIGFRS